MKQSSPHRILLPAVLAAALTLSACSKKPENPVLATVGPAEITRADFIDAVVDAQGGGPTDLTTPEGRRTFLDDLVNRQLMLLESRKMFPEPPDFQKSRLVDFSRSTLTGLLMDTLVRAQSQVSQETKAQYYADMQKDVFLEGLLLPTKDMAQAMIDRIDAGADLGDLAAEYSVQEYDGDPGVIGWVSANTYLWEMEKVVWNAPPGKILGPFPNRFSEGFWVVRVKNTRKIPAEDTMEHLDQKLTNDLQEQIYMSRQQVVQDSIKAASGLSFPESGAALMMLKYYWEPPEELRDDPMAYLKDDRVPPTYTAAEETVTVVGFTKYPSWTAVDFTQHLNQLPTGLWPRGHDRQQLQDVYDMVTREFLHYQAALELGLDKTEKFHASMEKRERRMRLNYLYHNVITAGVDPTEEEVQAWFEEHRERYKAPPSVKIAFFGSGNVQVMQQLHDDWAGGMRFNDVRQKYESLLPDLEAMGESPFIPEGTDPGLDGHIVDVAAGEVAPPFLRSDRSYVFKVVERRGSRLVSYEEGKDMINKDAIEMMKDEKLNAFLADAKQEFPIVINEQNLADLVIPDTIIAPVASGDGTAQAKGIPEPD